MSISWSHDWLVTHHAQDKNLQIKVHLHCGLWKLYKNFIYTENHDWNFYFIDTVKVLRHAVRL